MGLSVLFVITVAAASLLLPVHSKQDYKLHDISSTDISQIDQNGTEILNAVNCSRRDISILQGQSGLSYNGIPVFSVQIANFGPAQRDIHGIHLNCGQFTSVNVINPMTFKRLAINDCLVNAGRPLQFGSIIQFRYTTSFMQPLSVASVAC